LFEDLKGREFWKPWL